jgi:hypothetical protein
VRKEARMELRIEDAEGGMRGLREIVAWGCKCPKTKRGRFLQEPHGVTLQKTPFFIIHLFLKRVKEHIIQSVIH